jgi:hypothetical protein
VGREEVSAAFAYKLAIRLLDDSIVKNLTLALKILSKLLSSSDSDFFAAPSRRALSMTWLKEIDLCYQLDNTFGQSFTMNYETAYIVF